MRSRNTLLLLVFLVLAAFAAYFFLNKNESRSTLNVKETAFAVSDTASVDKIFIGFQSGKSSVIERKPGNNWVINGKYEARKDLVQMLLETLKRMEVKRPVDKVSRNSTIRDLAAIGRKVEIYQNGELSKTFYVGQTTDDDLGTYFIMEGSETPYVMHIPGFMGFLNTRFDLDEKKWRSVPVFRSSPETLQKLAIDYYTNPENNFTIEKTGNEFQVSGVKNVDQENLKAYLENYKFINGEYFFTNTMNRLSDSLATQKPVARIAVTDAKPENSATYLLYARPTDQDRLVAVNPKTKDIISVQTYNFDRLMIKKEALLKK